MLQLREAFLTAKKQYTAPSIFEQLGVMDTADNYAFHSKGTN